MVPPRDLDGYVAAAIQHGEATESSNSDGANDAYKRIQRHWDSLRTGDGDWRASFLRLLRHESRWVRLWAASHALGIDPDAAVAVLERLGAERGPHAFDAQMTLQTWRQDRLNPTN